MQKRLALLATSLLLSACAGSIPTSEVSQKNDKGITFQTFYTQFKKEAAAKGYNPNQLDASFSGHIAPISAVVSAEKSQPETVRSFAQYAGSMLSADRVKSGTENLEANRTALTAIEARTGVPASVVVALWGIETNFGKVQGDHPVIPALITLAWKSPRADYFRKETYAALDVLKKTGKQPAGLKGSWAGAMGQCQFMPSSYLAYATDGDNDGVADIWANEADVFASAATYLQKRGWKPGAAWRTTLAPSFNARGLKLNERGLSDPQSLSFWQDRGAPTGLASGAYRYYKPQEDAPAYLLGPNFDVILSWNNSSYFAWSVLALADAIKEEAN